MPFAACTACTTGLMSASVAARSSISAACPSAETKGLPGLRSVCTSGHARARLRPRAMRRRHERLESGVGDGGALRADHDHVGRATVGGRSPDHLVVEGLGLRGRGRSHDMLAGRQAVERGAGEHQRHHDGKSPHNESPLWPPSAGCGQPFGQACARRLRRRHHDAVRSSMAPGSWASPIASPAWEIAWPKATP